ncbi:MAG: hypothetical protein AB8C13_02620 [Phycisphaerales bacterium]
MLFKRNKNKSNNSDEANFWDWFIKSNLLETSGEEFIEQISPQLGKIHEVLVAEVGPVGQSPRELIISSDGIREGIVHVERLADSAPDLDDWKITRFRLPLPNYETIGIRFGDVHRNPQELMYTLHENGSLFDIDIYASWCEETAPPDIAIFIFLDKAIGEYNVMCRIGEIRLNPMHQKPDHASTWNQLQAVFV